MAFIQSLSFYLGKQREINRWKRKVIECAGASAFPSNHSSIIHVYSYAYTFLSNREMYSLTETSSVSSYYCMPAVCDAEHHLVSFFFSLQKKKYEGNEKHTLLELVLLLLIE